MRTYVGDQEAHGAFEFAELAYGFEELPAGIDRDLFRGPLGPESSAERAARLDVAREVLADLHRDGAADEIAASDAAYAAALLETVPLAARRPRVRRSFSGTGEAA